MIKEEVENLGYTHIKQINGVWCGLYRFIFTVGLVVDIDSIGYKYRYCFNNNSDAKKSLHKYENLNELPTGNWIKRKGIGGDISNPNYDKKLLPDDIEDNSQSAADDYLDYLSDQW